MVTGFPCDIASFKLCNRFTSNAFDKNVHRVFIMYGKCKISILFCKFSSLLLMKVLKMLISLRSKNNIWEICHVMAIISSHVELIQYEKCFLLFVVELWLVQPHTTDLLVHGTNLHHHSNIFSSLHRPFYITPQTNNQQKHIEYTHYSSTVQPPMEIPTSSGNQGSHMIWWVLICDISEFGPNLHYILKTYGNCKCSHLLLRTFLFTANDSFADALCIVFHEKMLIKFAGYV